MDAPSTPLRQAHAPFASTGPHGHRARMRARLLANGPDGLADYEVLEMLLFLSIPRRDTKPLAKTLINRFGAFSATLAAPAAELHGAGLDGATAGIFGLVSESARRLTQAEARSRPLLNDMARLLAYLDLPARLQRPAHLAVLLLNNRNQLLDAMQFTETPLPAAPSLAAVAEAAVKQAILVHATALILVTCRPGVQPDPGERDVAVTDGIVRRARTLSITVHDHWLFGAGETVSFKQFGLL